MEDQQTKESQQTTIKLELEYSGTISLSDISVDIKLNEITEEQAQNNKKTFKKKSKIVLKTDESSTEAEDLLKDQQDDQDNESDLNSKESKLQGQIEQENIAEGDTVNIEDTIEMLKSQQETQEPKRQEELDKEEKPIPDQKITDVPTMHLFHKRKDPQADENIMRFYQKTIRMSHFEREIYFRHLKAISEGKISAENQFERDFGLHLAKQKSLLEMKKNEKKEKDETQEEKNEEKGEKNREQEEFLAKLSF